MSRPLSAPTPFQRSPQPLIDGGDGAYLRTELQNVHAAIESTQLFTPCPAIKAPASPVDGMIRLARKPWRPVAGQTVDKWVYYDGVGAVWRYLGTDPTNTP